MLRKHILTFLILLAINTMATGQKKVGINKTNPQETLDVGGHINVDGVLKVQGTAGNAGQVLMANGASGMSWTTPSLTNPSSFQYHVTYTGSTTFWIIPAGVTRFMVEAWGGGGGGSSWSGGGAGGYVAGFFENAVPTTTVGFTIGTGGAGGTYTAGNGQNTQVIYNETIRGLGGEGARISSSSLTMTGGTGGGFYHTSSFLSYYGLKGEDGAIGIQEYYQYTTPAGASYSIIKIFGADGGNGSYTTNTGGKGGFEQRSGADFEKAATPGSIPAGGGGGGYSYFTTASSGAAGGDGMVTIHY